MLYLYSQTRYFTILSQYQHDRKRSFLLHTASLLDDKNVQYWFSKRIIVYSQCLQLSRRALLYMAAYMLPSTVIPVVNVIPNIFAL